MYRSLQVIFLILSFFVIFDTYNCLGEEEQQEATGYISDFLVINLRDNIQRPFTVTGVVKSEEEVKIIEENNEYFKVRTQAGKTGWIAKQYVKSALPKSVIIQQLQEKITQLEKKLQGEKDFSSQDDVAVLRDTLKTMKKELDDKNDQIARLSHVSSEGKKIETVVKEKEFILVQLKKLKDTYNNLLEEYTKEKSSLNECHSINSRLKDLQNYYWFGCGALVFFFGILVGKIGGRKKSKFSY